jgi:hypothetical protein
MTPQQLDQIRWMRSNPRTLEFDSSRIDAEQGILYDVVMAEEGDAKGYDVALEEEFINDLIAYDIKHYSKIGVKNRFGHPNASGDTMGTQMGRFLNFRTRKKGGKMQAIADLHLLEASNLSPTKPNMKEWMVSMAKEAPDFVMQSIVFKPGRYYQKFKDGSKRHIWEYQKTKQQDGSTSETWISSDPVLGKIYVEFGAKGEHYYTDTVEAGAATESLFSNDANPHLFVSKALSWLEDHPELKSFAQQHPEKVSEFLSQLGIQLQTPKPKNPMNLLEKLFGKKEAEDTELSAEELQELRSKMSEVETMLSKANTDMTTLTGEVKSLKETIETKDLALSKANARIEELEKEPAAGHTNGDKGDEGDSDVKSYHKDPMTARAIASYQASKKKAA